MGINLKSQNNIALITKYNKKVMVFRLDLSTILCEKEILVMIEK